MLKKFSTDENSDKSFVAQRYSGRFQDWYTGLSAQTL